MPVCGKATAGGWPCQRPVRAPGAPCGADHPEVVSPTGAPPSGTFGPGGGPPPDPLPAAGDPLRAVVALAAVRHAVEVDDDFGGVDEWRGVWDDLAGLDPVFGAAARAAEAAEAQHREHMARDDRRYDLSPDDLWRSMVDVDELQTRAVELAGGLSAADMVTAAESDEPAARSFAVMHGDLPDGLVARLAGDDDWEVRWRVANRSDAPVAALVRLSGDGDEEIRLAVANHALTPPATLLSLAADEHPSVAGAAAAHPRCPPAGRAAAGLVAG